jgi:hypothetical protein
VSDLDWRFRIRRSYVLKKKEPLVTSRSTRARALSSSPPLTLVPSFDRPSGWRLHNA